MACQKLGWQSFPPWDGINVENSFQLFSLQMDSETQYSTLSESKLSIAQISCSSNSNYDEPANRETPSGNCQVIVQVLSKSKCNIDQISCSSNSNHDEPNQEVPSVTAEVNSQKIYKCSQCDATFFRSTHLEDHLNRHTGDRKYQCKEEDCSKAYFAWKHLRKHLIATHKLDTVKKSSYVKKEIDETGGKRHKCSYEGCNAAYDRRWKLISHMCKHTGEKLHPCTENGCDKSYTTIGHLRRHIAKSHTPRDTRVVTEYSCPQYGCAKVYKTVESVKRHYVNHHGQDGPKRPPVKCEPCGRKFATPEPLDRHKCASYKCEDCNLEFICVAAWKDHIKAHQTFQCQVPECSKIFPELSLLKEHKKMEHKKSFPCHNCEKKFSSKTSVREHQQTHLLPEEKKQFPCPYSECSRFYTRKFNLEQHIRSSHEDIKFHCTMPGCDKRLVTKQKLQEHMKLHDPLREPLPRKQIARNQRKDKGIPKRSMAVKLTGMEVSYAEEQHILHSGINKLINRQYASKSSEEWSELSETDVLSDLSDFSDEMSEQSDASDEWVDPFNSTVDSKLDLWQSKYREFLEGRMTGAQGTITQFCNNSSVHLIYSPQSLDKIEQPLDLHCSVVKQKE